MLTPPLFIPQESLSIKKKGGKDFLGLEKLESAKADPGSGTQLNSVDVFRKVELGRENGFANSVVEKAKQ